MTSFISHYAYLAVFVLMLAESACIPIPSEVIMLFAGAFAAGAVGASAAHPALVGVVAAGVAGNVAGSYLAWAVGKYAGQPAVHRWGRRIGVREHEVDRATAWFERYGPAAVLIGRIVPVIRTFISLPAGFADMSAGRFGLYTTLGCIPWTAGLAIGGYAVGKNWQQISSAFHSATYVIAGIIVIAVVAGIIVIRRRRKAIDAGGPSAASAGPGPSGQEQWPRSEQAAQAAGEWRTAGQSPAPSPDPWGPDGAGYPAGQQRPPSGRQGW